MYQKEEAGSSASGSVPPTRPITNYDKLKEEEAGQSIHVEQEEGGLEY